MTVSLVGWRKRPDVVAFVRWLEGELDIRHDLLVVRCPAIDGYFDAPMRNHRGPWMLIADVGDVLDTIAHEFTHYEQWRDHGICTERGVARRAASLVRRYRKETA